VYVRDTNNNLPEQLGNYNQTNIKRFKPGTKVAITEVTRKGSVTGGNKLQKRVRKGTVIFTNRDYFTVQFKNYKSSFNYKDILVGDIEAKKIN
jgi:hypothetical protein